MIKLVLFSALICGAFSARLDPMTDEDLLEGDILGISMFNAIPLEAQKWPQGIVYYEMTPELKENQPFMKEFNAATTEIELNSCVRFIPKSWEKDYILIHSGGGCSSFVGRVGGMQELSLGKGCQQHGPILHELLHAIGFFHEHRRSDRDDHIKVHYQNIDEKNHRYFHKLQPHENALTTKFDLESTMIFGSYAYSNKKGAVTITKKDGGLIRPGYRRPSLSRMDVIRLKLLYPC